MKGQPTLVCLKNPLENLFVGAGGTVSPCVYFNPPLKSSVPLVRVGRIVATPRIVMRRLTLQSLDEIWQSSDYLSFRQAFQRRMDGYPGHRRLGRIGMGWPGWNVLLNGWGFYFTTGLPPRRYCAAVPIWMASNGF